MMSEKVNQLKDGWIIVHVHVFDGPRVDYEYSYLGSSIMMTLKSRTCSTCGFLEDEFNRLFEGLTVIA